MNALKLLTPLLVMLSPGVALAADDAPSATKVTGKLHPADTDPFTVRLDVSDSPKSKDWAAKAGDYAVKWYPKLCELLASEGFEPAKDVTLRFKSMEGVAYTQGTTITISEKWIADHPEDLGMVAHELVHVVQQYKRTKAPGWLTEGIADYVRYYVIEPESPRKAFNADRGDYRSGYQPTAGMLNWIETKMPGTVVKLNALIRQNKYTPDSFKELAGDEPDAVWAQFKASLKKS